MWRYRPPGLEATVQKSSALSEWSVRALFVESILSFGEASSFM
jgi:hypothetical protein